jgi:hypothetical protein
MISPTVKVSVSCCAGPHSPAVAVLHAMLFVKEIWVICATVKSLVWMVLDMLDPMLMCPVH